MRKQVTFQIDLALGLIERFNKALDEDKHSSEQLSFTEDYFKKKKYCDMNAWHCICACVRRIRDTVEYLNDQVLGQQRKYRSAFDFINFINNAAVVLDSIDMLAKILGVDLSEENARTAVFNHLGKDGSGTDKKYFEYIRSLCAVHPIETSRHPSYQPSDLVTCPFLSWVRDSIIEMEWDCDLHANAFTNETSSWGDDVYIHMDQIFSHIKYRYSLLNKIEEALHRYHEDVVERFRNTPIPERGEAETEDEYIDRLKTIEIERFGSNNDFVYDFAKKAIAFHPSNPENLNAARRYANAWRFALELELNLLRDMTREGVEHAGIEDDKTDWILFEHLEYSHCRCPELDPYEYNLEKLGYLADGERSSDAAWGRLKLREVEPVFRPYVVMDLDNDSDEELYMLSRIAVYEIALLHDCNINRSIPRGSTYRR